MSYRSAFDLLRCVTKCVVGLGLYTIIVAQVTAQDIDDLFSDPDSTTAESSDETPENEPASETELPPYQSDDSEEEGDNSEAMSPPTAVDIGALTTSPTRVSGRVTAQAGFGLGFIEWPGSDAAEGRGVYDLAEYSILYDTTASMIVDSRPRPYLRFYSRLTTSLSESSLTFDTPDITSLFVDYTAADSVFLRAGTFNMGWGRARLFDNPANLVSRVDEGAAIRASVPAGRGSFTGLLYTRPAWVQQYGDDVNWRAFAWAGQWEVTRGSLTTELGAHWQVDEPLGSALSFTLGVRDLTLTAEGVYHWDQDNWGGGPDSGENSWAAIGNFFWENSNRSWSFWGEYQYDSDDTGGGEHLAGLAMRAPRVGRRGWRPGLSWRHAVEDSSGEFVIGMSGTVAPSLSLDVGVPVIYGSPGTYYRAALTQSVADDDDDDDDDDDEDEVILIPVDNVIVALFVIELSFSF